MTTPVSPTPATTPHKAALPPEQAVADLDWLHRQGIEHAFRFASEVLGEVVAQPTALGDALTALAAAALAVRYGT
jgi:hypothetical protein